MDFRLNEVASVIECKDTVLINRIEDLEKQLKKIEDRINLMTALKANDLDLSKFCFDLKPIQDKPRLATDPAGKYIDIFEL